MRLKIEGGRSVQGLSLRLYGGRLGTGVREGEFCKLQDEAGAVDERGKRRGEGVMFVNKGLDFCFSFSFPKIFLPLYRRANPPSIQCIQCM